MTAVFDSSAWVFLIKLGVIEQGISLFQRVIVPAFVKEEIAGRNDEAFFALEQLISCNRVEIMGAKSPRFVNALRRRLGKGESGDCCRIGCRCRFCDFR